MAPETETFDDKIARYISAGDQLTLSYDDANLWFRLRPQIEAEMTRAIGAIVNVTLQDHPTYREKIGYLHGLEWVLKEAAYLTRREREELS